MSGYNRISWPRKSFPLMLYDKDSPSSDSKHFGFFFSNIRDLIELMTLDLIIELERRIVPTKNEKEREIRGNQ